MKKLLIASVALAVASLGGPALAADMPLKAPPPPVPVFTWTGCYVGLSIGTNYGRARHTETAGSFLTPGSRTPTVFVGQDITDPFNLSGLMGGAQGGCDYQFAGGWVIGVAVDWSKTNKEGQRDEGLIGFENWVSSTKESWLGTARLRLGWAVTDKWLWYVTGGGAWARFDTAEWLTSLPASRSFTQTDWRGGWTVGVGTEYNVGYGWSITSEFLYVDFGTYRTFTTVPFTAPGIITNRDVRVQDYIWRVGMNYRFGWTPAVVARY
jgi:outer membrane immunogenic protein